MRHETVQIRIIKSIKLAALIVLSLVVAVAYSRADQEEPQIEAVQTDKEAVVHDATGNDFLDYLETNCVTVASIAKEEEILQYEVPASASVSGHELLGIYVENNSILYLRYEGDLYVIYHKDPSGSEPNIDETLKARPDASEVRVRNQRAIAASNQKTALNIDQAPESSLKIAPSATLGWHENGLHIAIYDYSGGTVEKLKSIAESMR